jgi:hypothetical protein
VTVLVPLQYNKGAGDGVTSVRDFFSLAMRTRESALQTIMVMTQA